MLGSMVLLAFSLQDQVEKYGAYVGIAAFFGLAILSLLYFAQAREVKRLRQWAGQAPELGAELVEEARQVAASAAAAARQQPARTVLPEPVPAATNGVVKLKPAEVAALAFARAAGVHTPHEPKHAPAPAAAPVAAPVATAVVALPEEEAAAVPAGEPAATQVLNGGGNGHPPAAAAPPPPATPAARQTDPPPPLPPRRTPPANARRSPAPAPRRESNTTAVVLTFVVGIVVLGAAAFGVTRLLGGDDGKPTKPPVVPTVTPDQANSTATAAPALTKDNALVMVFNGTSSEGLAARYRDQLRDDDGYPEANMDVATLAEAEQRATSTVMYAKRNARTAARGVASALGIETVEPLDATTRQALASLPQSQRKDWNVVVIIGVDKSTQ